ncbi:MAG: DMT family transporter [Muribaculum sp.]|nr:DMT family transporter [Muribaculaceae bacterium]MCM1080211.1 DMT family transporter [Muribaculum sp.]
MNNNLSTSNQLRGNMFILIATIFFGINLPAQKILIPQWLSAIDMVVLRIAGATLLIWLTSLMVKCKPIEKGDRLTVFLSGAVFLFLFLYLFALSLRYGSAIDISIIMTLPAMFVVAINAIFFHHKINALEVAGLLVAFAGAVVVILSQGNRGGSQASNPLLGDMLALGSALCYALYLIFSGKVSGKYKPITLMRWIFLAALLPAAVFVPSLLHAPLVAHGSAQAWGYTAFVVILATYAAYILIPPAIKLIGSEIVGLYQYLVPVIAIICCLILKLERLQWDQPLAILIIIAGVWMTNNAKTKLNNTNTAPKNRGRL